MNVRVIGKEVWWDHKLQRFRPKRINLEKVPMRNDKGFLLRCPNCGEIIEKNPYYRYSSFPPIELRMWGGVCRKCYLDGFGEFGARGRRLKQELEEQRKKFSEQDKVKPIWINGKLKFAKEIYEIKENH